MTQNRTPRIKHYESKENEAKTTPKEKGKTNITHGTSTGPNPPLVMIATNGLRPLKAKDAVKDITMWTMARDWTPSSCGVISTSFMDTRLTGVMKIRTELGGNLLPTMDYGVSCVIDLWPHHQFVLRYFYPDLP
jgi:hypothetical protein